MYSILIFTITFANTVYAEDVFYEYKQVMKNSDLIINEIMSDSVFGPEHTKWSCPLPYKINNDIIYPNVIIDAIDYITMMTGWSFIERTDETDYIEFVNSSGCWSYLGKQGGRQEIGLSQYCGFGSIIHEIGHAIGLEHEQTRYDRDNYVDINFSNIEYSKIHNFNKKSTSNLGDYDFNSIMHYGRWSFAVDDDVKTIIPIGNLDNVCYIGQRSKLSNNDIHHLNSLIDGNHCSTTSLETIINQCNPLNIEICGATSETNGFLELIFTEFVYDGVYNGQNKYRSLRPYNGIYFTIDYYNSLFTDYWRIQYGSSEYAYTYDSIFSNNWYIWDEQWILDSSISITQKECCEVLSPFYIGDGYCDRGNYNTEVCMWDGGDCCQESCSDDSIFLWCSWI